MEDRNDIHYEDDTLDRELNALVREIELGAARLQLKQSERRPASHSDRDESVPISSASALQ